MNYKIDLFLRRFSFKHHVLDARDKVRATLERLHRFWKARAAIDDQMAVRGIDGLSAVSFTHSIQAYGWEALGSNVAVDFNREKRLLLV
jgi:hypothetical protein